MSEELTALINAELGKHQVCDKSESTSCGLKPVLFAARSLALAAALGTLAFSQYAISCLALARLICPLSLLVKGPEVGGRGKLILC
jgi:hypothetical protein